MIHDDPQLAGWIKAPIAKEMTMIVDSFLTNFHVCQPEKDFVPKRVICLPVDESQYSTNTVQWAMKNILEPTDLVLLLNVRPQANEFAPPVEGYNYYEPFREIVTQQREGAEALLKGISKQLNARGYQVEALSLVGDPRQALHDEIKKRNPSMVIVGQRGMGPLSRLVIGSVSDHLVHHAHCPVVVVTK
jgi:nucleotide-binding universal stress UspA family protein